MGPERLAKIATKALAILMPPPEMTISDTGERSI
jgi:hypothetical protein